MRFNFIKSYALILAPSTNDKVDTIINSFSSNPNSEDSVLITNENIIKDAFSFDTIEQIFEKCELLSSSGNEFLNSQFEELKHKSPTSLKISLKQIRDASTMTLKDELIMEYRMVQRCLAIGDFFEGVRAMLVDKDRKPNWKPFNIKDVDESRVNKFFEDLGDLDLSLKN